MSDPVLKKRTIFVGRDPALDEVFDDIARAVRRLGATVVRQRHPGRLPEDISEFDVLCLNSRTPVNQTAFRRASRLVGLVYVTNGTDSCDVTAAGRLGIPVLNGATQENVESMAEATVMLMSALLLQLPAKQRWMAPDAHRPSAFETTSRMLAGKNIGFVGFGRIAQAAVQRLAGWRPGRVLAHTRTPSPKIWPTIEFTSLERLFRDSDVVNIGVPLTSETKSLVNKNLLRLMKPSAYVVVTSRGGIVCERDLVYVLENRHIAGAAIDVFENEPLAPDHPLRALDNVILTPHAVGHTIEMFESLAPRAVDSILSLCGQ